MDILLFWVLCCQVDVWDQLITRLEDSYWICVCVSNCVWSSNFKNEAALFEVWLLRQGREPLNFYSLHNVIVPKPKVAFARAPCCQFTFHTGCIITVCNLLLAVPDGRRNSRPVDGVEGTNYREAAVRKGAGASDTLHSLWLLAGPFLVVEPKNWFTRAVPAVGVPVYLGTDPVSVYIKV